MCWTYFVTIGHRLKILSPSQKTLRPSGVPSWLRAWSWVYRADRQGCKMVVT